METIFSRYVEHASLKIWQDLGLKYMYRFLTYMSITQENNISRTGTSIVTEGNSVVIPVPGGSRTLPWSRNKFEFEIRVQQK